MGSLAKGLFQGRWHPQLMLLRNRSKLNITKPRPPHYDRALVEYVCKPYFNVIRKPQYIPDYNLCGKEKKKTAEKNLYEDFLAKQFLKWIENSKLIAIFHVNTFTKEENFEARVLLRKNGMKLLSYNRQVVKYALTGTKYEPIFVLYKSHTSTVVSEEPKLHTLMNILPKLPKLVLLAAVIEDKFLSFTELQYYSSFKSLEEARMKLVGTLNASSQNLVQQLNHVPNNLVQLLDQHHQLNKDKNSDKMESSPDK